MRLSGISSLNAASVDARSIGMENVTVIGASSLTLSEPARAVALLSCHWITVGSAVRNVVVYGAASTPPVVSSSPARTVTV